MASAASARTKSAPSKAAGKSTSAAPAAIPAFSREQELSAYREMLLIRRFEEKAGQLYGMGLIGGFCHLYIGQEAVVIGMQMALKEGDQIITGYRDHGHMLACGMDPKGVMAELTGRRGGLSKGKGGSMHMFSKEKQFYGGHGIVGGQVSLGTGLAFANHYRNNGSVSMIYFGDGAANQGQVYESFNMAELWKLPAIYIIENNRYAMGTAVSAARFIAVTNSSMRLPWPKGFRIFAALSRKPGSGMRTFGLPRKPSFLPSNPTAASAPFSRAAFSPWEASVSLRSLRDSAWACA